MNGLVSVISIAALLFVILVLFNQQRIDYTRQKLFEVRDSLFDEAAAGHIHFNSSAYVATRVALNGMIRYAHRLSLSRLLVSIFLVPKADAESAARAFDARLVTTGINDAQLCRRFIATANRLLARHFLSSPFLVVLPLVIVFVAAKMGVDLLAKIMRTELAAPAIAAFDELAYKEGANSAMTTNFGAV